MNKLETAELKIAYSADSDDVYNFFAWEHGRINPEASDLYATFYQSHICELNEAASNEAFDVVAISSAHYPAVAHNYWVLAVGTSVGRDWGPVLVSKNYHSLEELKHKRVGVGGHPTTGSCLALMACPELEVINYPYDQIGDAICRGELDAGVMIHEELIHFPKLGLHLVSDLGKFWCEETKHPLPVGLNIVHKRLGMDLAVKIAKSCQQSLDWAQRNHDQVLDHASQYGRGEAREHINMFSNQDTYCLPDDVRAGLRLMLDKSAQLTGQPPVKDLVIVDGY